MNKQRRKEIEDIIDVLSGAKDTLETLQEEEQNAYDNLPESIQYSERGEAMSDNANELEEAASSLDDILSNLQDIIDR